MFITKKTLMELIDRAVAQKEREINERIEIQRRFEYVEESIGRERQHWDDRLMELSGRIYALERKEEPKGVIQPPSCDSMANCRG